MHPKVNVAEAFELIEEYWDPHIAVTLNGQAVKLARLKGEFVWHTHENEDELFFVYDGALRIELRDRDAIELTSGEMIVIPKGVEHRPVAEQEVKLILFEPVTTLNTGNVLSERTKRHLRRV